jgi:hypothetical protein
VLPRPGLGDGAAGVIESVEHKRLGGSDMRKVSFFLSLAIVMAVGVGILLLATAQPVQAGGAAAAVVANQQDCTIVLNSPHSTYDGNATEVLTPSGQWILTCNAELTSGPGVDQTVHVDTTCSGSLGSGTGDSVLNPGGHAYSGCHN